MKFILLLFLITLQNLVYSQGGQEPFLIQNQVKDSSLFEIQLSTTLQESRMGVWEIGDYKIYIEIPPLEENFRNDYVSLINAMETQYKNDSVTSSRYKMYAERYLLAANQLKEAKNGFDLRSLVVYVGLDNEEQNKGNSYSVDVLIRQLVENGKAVVFYKGERIYTLKKLIQSDYIISYVKIYYNQQDNCAYSFFGHINW